MHESDRNNEIVVIFTNMQNNTEEELLDKEYETSDCSMNIRHNFHCNICGKVFKFQASLSRHNNKFHVTKYQCSTCNKVFSRQVYLTVHLSNPGRVCYWQKQGPALELRSVEEAHIKSSGCSHCARHDKMEQSIVNLEVHKTNDRLKTICNKFHNVSLVNVSNLHRKFTLLMVCT
ncbi:zinc finger protein 83-like [Schistocerca serialis cubense]|uniref:zinc finger protein 83-like n=1 Tax=Schistocerca serialis cubense TaxID=2023355 RepID=UPI00214E15D3|nr:zinc finger protein 83-like [Schistocerca serialis cubense]